MDQQSQGPMESLSQAQIKVVGVGGGGVNALRRMAQSPIPGVALLCINTDVASLNQAEGVAAIAIGEQATRGLGAGGDPRVGLRAAQETQGRLRDYLAEADLVFIAAGMGGGTGTGAAPVVAALAKEAGALTIAVVTTPFAFEGAKRRAVAAEGLRPLSSAVDTLIVVSNDQLLSTATKSTSMRDAFALADQVMVDAILAVSRLINTPGEINVDFADIGTVIAHGGTGLMAIGHGEGEHRAVKAARSALANPLLDISPQGAKSVLFAVTAGPDLTLAEVSEAGAFIAEIADPDAQIVFGMHIDPARESTKDLEMIIIATHLPGPQSLEPLAEVRTDHRKPTGSPADVGLPTFLRTNGSMVATARESITGAEDWWTIPGANGTS